VKRSDGTDTLYYVHKDHLGSIMALTNDKNTTVAMQNFDAWGRYRNPNTWAYSTQRITVINRGYTGHEHLTACNLINMNGRVYDPLLGMFLSPDNYVQSPTSTQNFNRYAYAFNNPLKYNDPSGDFITWSIGKHGFSIGFNLTPIGIPLGGGINIGWEKGASLGAYGEVGYRVGGTGLGAGVAAQQSLGYNFKHDTWSTTTTELAYASFGPLTVGGNLSQTYNFTNEQWSYSWGVNAGLGIGNEKGSIGFNVGYGSGGWNFGIGGSYYTSYERAYMRAEARNKQNIYDAIDRNLSNGVVNTYWGKMYIISNVNANASLIDGHAWIRVESITGKATTMSLWSQRDGANEFFLNRELYDGYGAVSKSTTITKLQYNLIIDYNSNPSNLNWTPWNTCAGYSVGLWNYVTGGNLSATDYFWFTTPRGLAGSINKNP